MANQRGGSRLLGRGSECAALDRLLFAMRAGRGQAIVLRGEAGVGKSALLDYLAERASGCRIERALGVEAEAELAFAGLHQLCAPMLGGLERLPEPQRQALSTAIGLGATGAPDLFLVGLALLGLISATAGERPLVCLVDDAQWLDRASARVLGFVARRLLAEPAALVFGLRVPCEDGDFTGLPVLAIEGLGDEDAGALLEAAVPGRLDAQVRDRIVVETRGNPLALLELPKALTAAELAGGFAEPAAELLTDRIERSFLRRVRTLPTASRLLLLAAAADPVGDVTLLKRAGEKLGIDADDASPAVAAGLIDLGTRVRFRHPLVRSAIYRTAAIEDRQAVHRALADVTDPETDPDRRAWHRAQSLITPDETVADELDRSAERAQRRGGVAAAAALLRRATALTPEATRRGARAVAAAQAMMDAGAPDAAHELIAAAELCPLNPRQRAEVVRLRARMSFAEHRGRDAPPLLVDAAARFAAVDAALARETYMEALEAAIIVGRLGDGLGLRAVARSARAAPPASRPARTVDVLLDATVTLLTEGYGAGVPALQDALLSFRREEAGSQAEIMRWLWMAPVVQEAAVHQLWDYETWEEVAARAVDMARRTGALAALPVALVYLAGARLHGGDLMGACGLIEEADAITATTRYAPVSYASMVLAAWQGDEPRALDRMASTVEGARARGEGTVLTVAGYATAVLYNGLGRYGAALEAAREGCEGDAFSFVGWSLVELVEAAARVGARAQAADALGQLEERTRSTGSDWGLGVLARSSALLEGGPRAEALYREGIERLRRSRVACQQARAHLVYGEWLRREGRRSEAREHLRSAHDMLEHFGAHAFAERARIELEATGEIVPRRATRPHEALTAQESRVASLAAEGHTNVEIGSHLFISPRTAEYHLRKVYAKLGIRSRKQLRSTLQARRGTAPRA